MDGSSEVKGEPVALRDAGSNPNLPNGYGWSTFFLKLEIILRLLRHFPTFSDQYILQNKIPKTLLLHVFIRSGEMIHTEILGKRSSFQTKIQVGETNVAKNFSKFI